MAAKKEGTPFRTPVGRIVWGHPVQSRNRTKKNPVTKQDEPVMKQDGTIMQEWSFGLAIPKDQFAAAVWPAMHAEASKGYPNGVPQRFAWKYVDGDSIDSEGKPYNQREGYAGCYVIAFSTVFQAPALFKFNGSTYDQLPAEAIKCGDFATVGGNCVVNVATSNDVTPSLYVNPEGVEFVAYGTEIINRSKVDPNAMFGGQQHQLPPGASLTPLAASGGAAMPGMPSAAPAPQAAPYPGQQPMPGYAPAPQPAAAPYPTPGAPQTGYAPAPVPQYTPAPQAAPVAPAYDYTGVPGPAPVAAPYTAPQAAPVPGMPYGAPGMMPGR